MQIHKYLSETYHYSDFQIAQIRYFVVSMLSEISKLILMGIFFFLTGYFFEYLSAAVVLCLLRTRTGGLHYKHYLSCFLFSFAFMYVGVCILPSIPTNKLFQLILLCLCIVMNYFFAPIVSSYRPIPDGIRVKKAKLDAFVLITLFAIILYIIPVNPYITSGFWIIILQSFQLIAAKLFQRRKTDEAFHEVLDF